MGEIPVFHGAQRVGTVVDGADGASFAYDPMWLGTPGAFPISILMPLSPARTPPGIFDRWATNMLPEGAQLHALARQLGTAPEDTVAILSKAGRDTAGALSIGGPGAMDCGGWSPVPDEATLERMLHELPQHPLLSGPEGLSTTLGGARAKLGVAVDAEGRICLPRNGAFSTHILKPDRDHLFGGVQNEALCLVLARRCSLNAPSVTTGKAGNRNYLLVTRYDRIEQAGRWRRLHQEDFCQALGSSMASGPTLAEVLAMTRHVMCAPDVLGLIDYFLFNALLCNPDTHARSFALMLSENGATLAPIHGLACMTAWDGISSKLDRMIAGEHMDRPQWEAFAADCGLNAGRLLARVGTLAEAVLANVREAAEAVAAMPAGPHPLLARLVMAIETRARRHRLVAERYRAPARRTGADRRGLRPMLSVVSPGG